jgi:hypothetical protein
MGARKNFYEIERDSGVAMAEYPGLTQGKSSDERILGSGGGSSRRYFRRQSSDRYSR